MDNELSKIGDTISNFLIDDNYKIDDTLEWSEMINVYIMRYRRIIGILILVILLGIIHHCSWKEDSDSDSDSKSDSKSDSASYKEVGLQKQTGGGNDAAVAAEMAKLRAVDTAQTAFAKEKSDAATAKGKADQAMLLATEKAAKKAGKTDFSKLGDKFKGTSVGKGFSKIGKGISSVGSSISSKAKELGETASSVGSHLKQQTYTGSQVSKLKGVAGAALGKSKLGKFASGKMSEISALKGMGMSKAGIAKELAGQAGQYAVDKFKDFSGWLYEILFALAISIAICMIIVPSIAFFALGLICYFLLRKKILSIKAI